MIAQRKTIQRAVSPIAAMPPAQMQPQQYQMQPIQRLSIASTAPDSPFVADSTPFFARCEDEIMSLHFGGRMGLLDLLNWQTTDVYLRTWKFITFVRPAYSSNAGAGTVTAGHLSDPCADPNGFEFGTAEMSVEGFGRYGRAAPVRDLFKPTRYCETDPRYRLDGSPVTSEVEWDMAFATDALMQDIFRDLIIGNSTTAGKFDGLQRWIKTGYDSPMLDSFVVNWAGNNMDATGGGTITVNGSNSTPGSLVNMILSIYRRWRQRMMWSPMLATQMQSGVNTVLVLPTFLIECLLDSFTCWSVCTGNNVDINSYEARTFRNGLLGGRFGYGRIFLDGQEIPLLAYDWETMHGTDRGDIYFLTLNVGQVRLWQGEHLSGQAVLRELAAGNQGYFVRDGGRILGKENVDNLCRQLFIWMRPRIMCRAPWLQARIMNVECNSILPLISPDPTETSFYPVTSFVPALSQTG